MILELFSVKINLRSLKLKTRGAFMGIFSPITLIFMRTILLENEPEICWKISSLIKNKGDPEGLSTIFLESDTEAFKN